MVLSLTVSVDRAAFQDPNVSRSDANPVATSDGKTFHNELKETSEEKMLRERKVALNRLFDKISLQPVTRAEILKSKGKGEAPSSSQSKRGMLERYDAVRKKAAAVNEEDEEPELSEIQLNMVCKFKGFFLESLVALMPLSADKKATKNDATLPEMEPAETFALQLRPCEYLISTLPVR